MLLIWYIVSAVALNRTWPNLTHSETANIRNMDRTSQSAQLHLRPSASRRLSARILGPVLALLAVTGPVLASTRPAQAHRHTSHQKAAASHPAADPQSPQSKPASIVLTSGDLTVHANNSPLSQILSKVAALSGMAVTGEPGDAHVFGTYGPGTPRDVLTQLLADSGCNFMMIGDAAEGAPRELLISARKNGSLPAAAPAAPASSPSDNANAGASDDDQEPLGPGAVPHAPPPPPEDPQQRMQMLMQRLQQMHQQQDQQNQSQ